MSIVLFKAVLATIDLSDFKVFLLIRLSPDHEHFLESHGHIEGSMDEALPFRLRK